MGERKYRVLIVASHPVQYASPIFRLMAQHPKLDILVTYCSLQGAEAGLDSGFGVEVQWDIPLLDGYPWIHVPNRAFKPGLGKFWGLVNPGLWQKIYKNNFDAVVIYTGYVYASFWISVLAAKISKIPLLIGADVHEMEHAKSSKWKIFLKKLLLRHVFNIGDMITVSSSGGLQFMSKLGIPKHRLQITPLVVNNEWWIQQAQQVNSSAIRQQWRIPENASVLLFCAKLQPHKRPHDVLLAFAKANIPNSYLVFVGEGSLKSELENTAKQLEVAHRVRFLGFVNQSQLPAVYCSSNLFILPSEYEPFGVVVNEAMLCGCPVVVSDRVGARYDLVHHGETGLVYPCADIDALAQILQTVLPDREYMNKLSIAAGKRMASWSPHKNVESFVETLEKLDISQPSLETKNNIS